MDMDERLKRLFNPHRGLTSWASYLPLILIMSILCIGLAVAGETSMQSRKTGQELTSKVMREPWSIPLAPVCKKHLLINESDGWASLSPRLMKEAQDEYNEEIRKGCVDVSSRAIQEKVNTSIWMEKQLPAAVGLKKPASVDYKLYSKKCSQLLSAINEKMKPGGLGDISVDLGVYQRDCIARFPQLAPAEDAEYFQAISNRIGVLYYPKAKFIFCTAFQIAPTVVATALHCLSDLETDGAFVNKQDIRFRAYADPQKDVPIIDFHYPIEKTQIKWYLQHRSHVGYVMDYALLELGGKLPMEDLFETGGSPTNLHPNLVIPGFHSLLAYPEGQLTPLSRRDEVLLTWTNYLYWDNSGSCRQEKVRENQCLQHSCSTVKGFSGSPILAFNSTSKNVVYLGVHSGTFGKSSCDFPPVDSRDNRIFDLGAPNLGSILDTQWVRACLTDIAAKLDVTVLARPSHADEKKCGKTFDVGGDPR